MPDSPLLLIAAHEFRITVRNRWTAIVAALFSLLLVGIAWAGVVAEGYSGVQSFTRTSASLLNLVLYVVPLMALVMGTLSFAGDRGTAELLFAQPVSRGEVMLGKLLGVFCSLALSMAIGFTLAGVVIGFGAGPSGLAGFAAFAVLSLLLALAFLSVAALIALLSGRRLRAFGVSMAAWFFFVIFYDLLAIGAASLLRGQAGITTLFLSLFGNPVDLVRVASLILLDNAEIFGAAGAALLRFLGGSVLSVLILVSALVLWIALPLAAAHHRLGRQDI